MGKTTHIFQGILFIITFIFGTPVAAQDVVADTAGIMVGAIRWDWTGDGSVNRAVEKSLGPSHWHYRVPFFGTIINDSTVHAPCASQECVDQEILYAKENGLDYWNFLLYPAGSDLDLPLRRYLSSNYNSQFKFTVMGNSPHSPPERVVNYFKHPSYLTVLGDRPLYYIYKKEGDHISMVRDLCASEGIPDPYVVHLGSLDDADAVSRYWYNGSWEGGALDGAPYSGLANVAAADWQSKLNDGIPQVPLVSAGTDGRPRIENPPPWGGDDNSYYAKYWEAPTPSELAASVQEAVNFVAAHPENCPSKCILMYAWNENDEGGWLTPTLDTTDIFKIDDSRLRALKEVLAPTNPARPGSKDASLATILVDGDTLEKFHPDTLLYEIELQQEGLSAPLVNGITTEPYARMEKTIDEANQYILMRVSSEDGSVLQSYRVNYSVTYTPPEFLGWEFNTPGDTEGWSVKWAGHTTIAVLDTVLFTEILDDYPEIINRPAQGINADHYERVHLKLRNSTPSSDFYFGFFPEDESDVFIDFTPTTNDTEFTEYTIDLSSHEKWKGTIGGLRFLYARMVKTGTVDIDYIRLELTDRPLSDEADLQQITINGTPLEDFDQGVFEYQVLIPEGTLQIPVVGATPTDPTTRFIITQADSPYGSATVLAVSESGKVSVRYSIQFVMKEIEYAPFFYSDFSSGTLPEGWKASSPGHQAAVNAEVFTLDISKTATADSYLLGDLHVSDFDYNPYMSLEYKSDSEMEIDVTLYGEAGVVSGTERFFLDSASHWKSFVFNLSALSYTNWTTDLDHIKLLFAPGENNYSALFQINEIRVGEEAMGGTFYLENHQPEPLEVDLGNDTTLASGASIVLNAGPADAYLWNTGATGQMITADTSGYYIVTIWNAINCSASDTIQVTIESNNIPEEQGQEQLRVYPNPTTDVCYIDPPDRFLGMELKLSLYDMTGSLRYQEIYPVLQGESLEFRTDKLIKGLFILEVEVGEEIKHSRLTIH